MQEDLSIKVREFIIIPSNSLFSFFVYPLVISTLVGTITYPESLGQFMAGKVFLPLIFSFSTLSITEEIHDNSNRFLRYLYMVEYRGSDSL